MMNIGKQFNNMLEFIDKLVRTSMYTHVQQDPYVQYVIAFYHTQICTTIASHTMILMTNTLITRFQLISTTMTTSTDIHPYINVFRNLPYFVFTKLSYS